jgi:hypothetical protein
MANKVYQYYTELPPWAKGVAVVGLLAVTYFTGHSIYKGIQTAINNKKANIAVDEAKTEITSLSKAGTNPSYPDSQYALWADKIKAQFDGCDWSVGAGGLVLTASGQTLFDIVLQLKNNADYLKLITAFGTRTYAECMSWLTKDFSGTLTAAVADELSTSEISKINAALSSRGITYQF